VEALDTGPYRVLFVCTGNICRSPMAHVIAEQFAQTRGREMTVRSASTMGLKDVPAEKNAVAVMREVGLDLTRHRSQPLTDELIDWAEYVLVMEYAHAKHIRTKHPQVEEKLMLLGPLGATHEISDPIGGWKYKFRGSRDVIQRCVEGFIDRLPVERR
jgi:protein-tyrosine-phosphatase